MLTITRGDVVLEAPELAKVDTVAEAANLDPDQVWAKLISNAGMEIRTDLTQDQQNRLGVQLVAHFAWGWLQSAAGTNPNGVSGPVTQVSVGGVSKSFAAPEAWTANAGVLRAQLATTKYGREFLRLARLFLGVAFATSGQSPQKSLATIPDYGRDGIDIN